MLKIRLQRIGRTNDPAYRVVLVDSHSAAKTGRVIELLGSYNPLTKASNFKADKIKEWMGKGALLSPTLHNLLINKKVIEGKKINVLPRKSPIKPEGEAAPVGAPTEAPKVEAAATESAEKAPESTPEEASA